MATENWLNENLCSFDEKVRIERGPQIVELVCNDVNLSNAVTSPYYQDGARDATGKVIRPSKLPEEVAKKIDAPFGVVEEGEKMAVVDRRAKHAPFLWKVYQLQETGESDKDGNPISRFIKVDEVEGKEDALARAKVIYQGMQ